MRRWLTTPIRTVVVVSECAKGSMGANMKQYGCAVMDDWQWSHRVNRHRETHFSTQKYSKNCKKRETRVFVY